jgi:N-carbamoyl-L-amino-acid hydrolase
VIELPSGAGHDATIMGLAGVPSAMLFVRSDAGGVSHAPEESTGMDAVACCIQVLERALRDLAAA